MVLKRVVNILFLGLLFSNVVFASSGNDQDIADVMEKNDIKEATMVISSEDGDVTYIYNQARANLRLSPASTFKIPNSIIALEEGIIKDQYEVIKWDGKKRFLDAWNKDQNLKTAFQTSCVWCYQRFAKKIGKETYIKYLKKLDYGNHLLGEDVATFWLAGENNYLRSTALEQINFLRRIYKKQLPISDKTYDVLKDIMLRENTADYQIYAKTGAATKDWKGHGWYVGYVVSKGKTWFFATNILIDGMKDLAKRKSVTIEALKRKKII